MILVCAVGTADRFHGFLRSVMLNPHPGVYVSVDLDAGSRVRIWEVLERWWQAEPSGTVVMLWRDPAKPMGIDFMSLGDTKREIAEFDGHWALRRRISAPAQSRPSMRPDFQA